MPFDDTELAKRLNEMGVVAMDTSFLRYDPDDDTELREKMRSLAGDLPVIAIYDAQRGNMMIPARKESRDERRERVGKLLWEYVRKGQAMPEK